MAGSPKISWQEFWELYKKLGAEQRDSLSTALGFVIRDGRLYSSPGFQEWASSLTSSEWLDVMIGAPYQLCFCYISRLNRSHVKKVAEQFSHQECKVLMEFARR